MGAGNSCSKSHPSPSSASTTSPIYSSAATEVVIGSPFEVEIGGLAYRLDPRNSSHLGPFVSLFPGSIRWLWTSAGGRLTAVFRSGARVTVTPDAVVKAWSVGSVFCMPAPRS